MVPPQSERPPTVAGFAPVLVANALPLVGVLLLDWDPATLAVIYVLEVLVSFPVAAVTALFAQQPPRADYDDEDSGVITVSEKLVEKRGAVTVASWLPPVYPRTVPFALAVVEAGVHFGAVVGVVLAATLPVPLSEVLARPEVTLSVVALVVGQSVDTWWEYVRKRRYEEATPYAVVETPARQMIFLIFALLVVPAGVTDGTVALAALVAVKLLVEWSAHRTTADRATGRLTGWLGGPDTTATETDSVAVPDGEPRARLPTDNRAVLATGVARILLRRAPFYVSWGMIVWIAGLAVIGAASATLIVGLTAAVVGLSVCLLAARAGVFYLRVAPLEYWCYEDRVVAYDTLVGEPQWASPLDVLREVTVLSDSLPDRLFGTRTIGVTTGWGERQQRRYLGPVADADALAAALDLPVATDLDPMDRRVAALTVGGVLAVFGVAVAALIDGRGEVVLTGAFLLPFVVLPLYGLWRRAYPERSDRISEWR